MVDPLQQPARKLLKTLAAQMIREYDEGHVHSLFEQPNGPDTNVSAHIGNTGLERHQIKTLEAAKLVTCKGDFVDFRSGTLFERAGWSIEDAIAEAQKTSAVRRHKH